MTDIEQKSTHLHIRVFPSDKERWEKIAERERKSFSRWVTETLNKATEKKR